MIDYEKLLDALKTIQDECAKYKFCTDCPFFVHSDDNNCGILSRNPVNWKLNKVHVIRLINQSTTATYRSGRAFRDRQGRWRLRQYRVEVSMTNLDKMRTMSPEELGTFLSNLVTIEDCFECPIRDVCNECMVNPNNEAFHTCELSFYHWLQREYKPGYFENQ